MTPIKAITVLASLFSDKDLKPTFLKKNSYDFYIGGTYILSQLKNTELTFTGSFNDITLSGFGITKDKKLATLIIVHLNKKIVNKPLLRNYIVSTIKFINIMREGKKKVVLPAKRL